MDHALGRWHTRPARQDRLPGTSSDAAPPRSRPRIRATVHTLPGAYTHCDAPLASAWRTGASPVPGGPETRSLLTSRYPRAGYEHAPRQPRDSGAKRSWSVLPPNFTSADLSLLLTRGWSGQERFVPVVRFVPRGTDTGQSSQRFSFSFLGRYVSVTKLKFLLLSASSSSFTSGQWRARSLRGRSVCRHYATTIPRKKDRMGTIAECCADAVAFSYPSIDQRITQEDPVVVPDAGAAPGSCELPVVSVSYPPVYTS